MKEKALPLCLAPSSPCTGSASMPTPHRSACATHPPSHSHLSTRTLRDLTSFRAEATRNPMGAIYRFEEENYGWRTGGADFCFLYSILLGYLFTWQWQHTASIFRLSYVMVTWSTTRTIRKLSGIVLEKWVNEKCGVSTLMMINCCFEVLMYSAN